MQRPQQHPEVDAVISLTTPLLKSAPWSEGVCPGHRPASGREQTAARGLLGATCRLRRCPCLSRVPLHARRVEGHDRPFGPRSITRLAQASDVAGGQRRPGGGPAAALPTRQASSPNQVVKLGHCSARRPGLFHSLKSGSRATWSAGLALSPRLAQLMPDTGARAPVLSWAWEGRTPVPAQPAS